MRPIQLIDFFERYTDLIIPEPNSGCWIWLGAQITAGYGHGNRNGEHFYAHRAAFECVNGVGSLDGLICRHGCDFPPCCNPDHLLSGSHTDNAQDMIRRGRGNAPRGSRHPRAVLTEDDIRTIRTMGGEGHPLNWIAELFPVRRNQITAILDGKSWKHNGPGVQWTRQQPEPPHKKGSENPNALLNEAGVIDIRRRLSKGERGTALAKEYGIKPTTITAIKKRRIWAHLEE